MATNHFRFSRWLNLQIWSLLLTRFSPDGLSTTQGGNSPKIQTGSRQSRLSVHEEVLNEDGVLHGRALQTLYPPLDHSWRSESTCWIFNLSTTIGPCYIEECPQQVFHLHGHSPPFPRVSWLWQPRLEHFSFEIFLWSRKFAWRFERRAFAMQPKKIGYCLILWELFDQRFCEVDLSLHWHFPLNS